MRVCFDCGGKTEAPYCERDGMATYAEEDLPGTVELRPAHTVGSYRVEARIAKGGMGEIYRAVHVRTGALVALKALLVPQEARRFFHEARATASLSPHPNIVQIYDFNQSEEGVFYLVMELLEGETLAARLRAQGTLSESDAAALALQVLDGLSHAHERDLIHRDLTPSNLFLHQLRPGHDLVKILDFGIAKIPRVPLTQSGVTMGTADYMSPERCVAEPGDPRSDLYSLGVVLYESVVGTRPFEAQDTLGVMWKHAREPVPSLADNAPAPLSAAFVEVVHRALEKRPEDRFADAAAMREAMLRVLGQGRPPAEERRASRRSIEPRVPRLSLPSLSSLQEEDVPDLAGVETQQMTRPAAPLALGAPTLPMGTAPVPVPLLGERTFKVPLRRGPRPALLWAVGALCLFIGAAVLSLSATYLDQRRHQQAAQSCLASAELLPLADRLAGCAYTCARGNGAHCLRKAELLLDREARSPAPQHRSAVEGAAQALSSACEAGLGRGCYRLGLLYTPGAKASEAQLEVNRPRAEALHHKACERGALEGCLALAELRQRGRPGGGAEGEGPVLPLLRRACEGGLTLACYRLADLYADSPDAALRDEVRAANLYQRACDQQMAMACTALGLFYEFGRGVRRDELRAAALYQLGCDGNSVLGCYALGELYYLGRGVHRDEARAAALALRPCETAGLQGCRELGQRYEEGRGVRKDEVRAAGLYQRACDLGDTAGCAALGALYEGGRGVPRDEVRAVLLFRQACDAGLGGACWRLGGLYDRGRGVRKDEGQAATFYRRACDAEEAPACHSLGRAHEAGSGVPRDGAQAVVLYRRACEGGAAEACADLGRLYAQGGSGAPAADPAQAVRWSERACRGGSVRGCSQLGVMYQRGQGVGRDEVRALALFQQACEGGEPRGCSYLGALYLSGQVVGRDEGRGVRLLQRGCKSGDGWACDYLKQFGPS